jgi:hypothetical protein
MAHFIAQKDPNEVTDYAIDWGDWLEGDSIATSTWTVPAGITKDSDAKTASVTTIWLSGGTDNDDYILLNTIATVSGRTEERDILILCRVSGVYTIGGTNIIDDIRFEIDDEETPFTYSKDRINLEYH